MDFSWLAEPHTWIGFATLFVLEVVLGIDNLVFVAILANKVKPDRRDRARVTGLGLAVLIRIIMLAFMAHIMTLTWKGTTSLRWRRTRKNMPVFGTLSRKS